MLFISIINSGDWNKWPIIPFLIPLISAVGLSKKKNYEDGALISFTYFHNDCGFHFQFIEWSHRFNLHKWPLDMQRSNYVKSKISIDIGEQLFRYVHDVKENKCPTREFANISIELIMAAEE